MKYVIVRRSNNVAEDAADEFLAALNKTVCLDPKEKGTHEVQKWADHKGDKTKVMHLAD